MKAGRAITAWVAWSQSHARLVVLAATALTAALIFYTVTHLSVDTNSEHLISPDLSWRRSVEQLDRAFPQLSNTLAVVIDATSPDLAAQAQQRLVAALAPRTDAFVEVFALETEPFFRRNGLLYLQPQQIQSIADALTRAQPFLGTLDEDPSLASLFTLLTRVLQRPQLGVDLAPALARIADTVAAVNAGRTQHLSWAALMGGGVGPTDSKRRFIEISPRFEFDRLLPAGRAIDAIRTTASALQLTPENGVTVRLTGSVAMEHEELLTAVKGAGVSLGAALVMVAVLLFLALRSLRLVLAAILTLTWGLTFTAAFAAAAIGHLNLISVAFAVLYVGLGIDYALYLSMEYRELLGRGEPSNTAMRAAARRVGGFMVVCAATTSIGFLAFIPTAFTAIAELGAISAFGMLMSLLMSITLLPALVELMRPDPQRAQFRPGARLSRVLEWPYRHARGLWIGAAIAAVAAVALVPRLHFDADPVDLRDPNSESVATYRELLKDPDTPTLTLSALARDLGSARALAAKLAALSSVKQALTLQSFVPEDQDAKLQLIDDLAVILGPDFTGTSGPDRLRSNPRDERSITEMIKALRIFLERATAAQSRSARLLFEQLQRFQTQLASQDARGRERLLEKLRDSLLGTLPPRLRELRETLQAQPVTIADLPRSLVQRWASADGNYRVEAWPREILDGVAPMERFLNAVRSVAPQAVGPPLVILKSGEVVVDAFQRAFIYSLMAITLLLLLILRRPFDVALAMLPLVFAGLFTVAAMVLFGLSFNFANVIALPLILGVGIDYGVYLVQRGRESEAAAANLLRSGAARAVFFGALTTIASFGNLVWAQHPGTVSLGILLSLGLGFTMTCALVFLPSLMLWRLRAREREAPA